MAFIEKQDPVVLNIKLTSKGRELLSEGKLNFSYFGLGDSEIDYKYINDFDYNGDKFSILRPTDKNPEIISFVTQEISGDTLNSIENVPSLEQYVDNNAGTLGFFEKNNGEYSFISNETHVKQPDIMVELDNVTGGNVLEIKQAPTYTANVNEPEKGDYVLIKWDYNNDSTGYTVNTNAVPYLIYKIVDIDSGSLANNNLNVIVDRNLPNFSGVTSNIKVGGVVFYSSIDFNLSVNYAANSVISFLENSQNQTEEFPYWNLSIIFTEEVAGVQDYNKKYDRFRTRNYAGFVSYIQNQAPKYKKLGVIHYTNQTPSNMYGEEFYRDTPKLELPTIIWHKSTGTTMGLTLHCDSVKKTLTGDTKSLDTKYYDLVDDNGYVVGKTFRDLKLFVIEDQELLNAMSYKSNRNWTMPDYEPSINAEYSEGEACTPCELSFTSGVTQPQTIDEKGSISITDITMSDSSGTVIAILESSDGMVKITKSYSDGDDSIDFYELDGGIYKLTLYDLSSPNCVETIENIEINEIDSELEIYDVKINET